MKFFWLVFSAILSCFPMYGPGAWEYLSHSFTRKYFLIVCVTMISFPLAFLVVLKSQGVAEDTSMWWSCFVSEACFFLKSHSTGRTPPYHSIFDCTMLQIYSSM